MPYFSKERLRRRHVQAYSEQVTGFCTKCLAPIFNHSGKLVEPYTCTQCGNVTGLVHVEEYLVRITLPSGREAETSIEGWRRQQFGSEEWYYKSVEGELVRLHRFKAAELGLVKPPMDPPLPSATPIGLRGLAKREGRPTTRDKALVVDRKLSKATFPREDPEDRWKAPPPPKVVNKQTTSPGGFLDLSGLISREAERLMKSEPGKKMSRMDARKQVMRRAHVKFAEGKQNLRKRYVEKHGKRK